MDRAGTRQRPDALIPYAEDVHTGLDVRRAGYRLVYVPVVLSALIF